MFKNYTISLVIKGTMEESFIRKSKSLSKIIHLYYDENQSTLLERQSRYDSIMLFRVVRAIQQIFFLLKIYYGINFIKFFIQSNYFGRSVVSNEKQSNLDSGIITMKTMPLMISAKRSNLFLTELMLICTITTSLHC